MRGPDEQDVMPSTVVEAATVEAEAGSLANGRRFASLGIGMWLAIAWLGLVVFGAVFAGVLPIEDPSVLTIGSTSPFLPVDLLSSNPLGTNHLGQDTLSRVIYGARPSLIVGLSSVLIGFTVGGILGIIAGFVGRAVEAVTDVLTNVLLAFPPLLLLLAVVAALSPSVRSSVIALSILAVPAAVRVARANTIRLTQEEHIFAARVLGARDTRIMVRELLPSVLIALLPLTLIVTAFLIVAEGTLSFLGLGVQPPTPSWGNMIADAQPYLRSYPALLLVPSLALLLTILSFTTIGEHLSRRLAGAER